MKIYRLEREQHLPISLTEAWTFFSKPENLEKITPKDLHFRILNKSGEAIHAGQMISYHVAPVAGIKMFWLTEITHVKDKNYFVDEQRTGPYQLWHHAHYFEETSNGIVMKDIVHYALPLGILGRLAHAIFVRQRLQHIFNFRMKILDQLFKA